MCTDVVLSLSIDCFQYFRYKTTCCLRMISYDVVSIITQANFSCILCCVLRCAYINLIHIGAETKWPPFRRRHFQTHFLENENVRVSIKISLKFVPKGPINNIPALVQIMAWRRPSDKPLSEPMMVSSLTHICVTRPQWVNYRGCSGKYHIRPCSSVIWGCECNICETHRQGNETKNTNSQWHGFVYHTRWHHNGATTATIS